MLVPLLILFKMHFSLTGPRYESCLSTSRYNMHHQPAAVTSLMAGAAELAEGERGAGKARRVALPARRSGGFKEPSRSPSKANLIMIDSDESVRCSQVSGKSVAVDSGKCVRTYHNIPLVERLYKMVLRSPQSRTTPHESPVSPLPPQYR